MSTSNPDGRDGTTWFKSRRRVEIERDRFDAAYQNLWHRQPSGDIPVHYVQKRGALFNLFELYCCVKRHGGYEHLCRVHGWHRVAYDLCRVSKRRRDVAQAAQECYRQYLRPHDAELAKIRLKLRSTMDERDGDAQEDAYVQETTKESEGSIEKRRKLRTRSQPTQRRLKRRFKKRTSFDLLSTIPLTPNGKRDVVARISPAQRRSFPPPLIEKQTPDERTHAGDVWHQAVMWLRMYAQCPVERRDVEHVMYDVRWAGHLLRMRQKRNQTFQRQTARTILRQNAVQMCEMGTEKREESEEETEENDVKPNVIMEGPQYQAEIPEWRPRPMEEVPSRWDTQPVRMHLHPSHKQLVLIGDKRELRLLSQESRLEWMDECSDHLWRTLGSCAQDLALTCMGRAVQHAWSAEECERFELGFLKEGRNFASIQKEFLSSKSIEDLVLYYYSIWKQRRTPGAAKYYHLKQQRVEEAAQEEAIRQKEAESRRRQLSEESKRKRLDRSQQRKLKDVLIWIRSLAKNPESAQLNQTRPFYSCAKRMAQLYRSGAVYQQQHPN